MKFKRILTLLLAAVVAVVSMNVFVYAQEGLPFTDVKETDWFYADVGLAYEMGLINGRSDTVFAPNELLTCAEAVKLAACMYQIYMDDAPFVVHYEPWYQIYAEYCYENRIISREYNWSQPITRGAYMDIFSRALPAEALSAINTVEDGMIPDVPMTYRYAGGIYKLYRAGIVQGIDDAHRCSPDTYVKRSEVAAILTRMMFNDSRLEFSIGNAKDEVKIPTVTYPWELYGAKQPIYYTLEEYYALTPEEQKAFIDWFPTTNAYYEWLNSFLHVEETPVITYPWNRFGAKQPNEYTLKEFEALTYDVQIAFINWFPTQAAFSVWFENATEAAKDKTEDKPENEAPPANYPWEEVGAKQPNEYSWLEYEALTDKQKQVFENTFDSTESFDAWLEQAHEDYFDSLDLPWKNGGKQPSEYTYAEYEALTAAQQMAFQRHFGSKDFDEWLWKVQGSESGEENLPWEKPGGKQPSEYTYAEFEALTGDQQMAFQNHLGSSGFDAWLQEAQGSGSETMDLPWEKPGGKQPSEYTYAEFEALTGEQQMAFQNHLGSSGFDTWLQKVQGSGSETMDLPWEKPGSKQPSEYTYAEFEALTGEQQMAFQNHLGSKAFDEWLWKVQGNESGEENLPWEKPGGKPPSEYTYAEFEALTGEQQMAFQNHLGSSGFDTWLQEAQGSGSETMDLPWEKPGGKQPSEYTYAEFEALTGEQQMAFQNYLGSEDFDEWLQRVLP